MCLCVPGRSSRRGSGCGVLVVGGFFAGVAGLLRQSPASQPARALGSADLVPSPDVAGFAELAVGRWLEADAESADRVAALFLEDLGALTSGDSVRPVSIVVEILGMLVLVTYIVPRRLAAMAADDYGDNP